MAIIFLSNLVVYAYTEPQGLDLVGEALRDRLGRERAANELGYLRVVPDRFSLRKVVFSPDAKM